MADFVRVRRARHSLVVALILFCGLPSATVAAQTASDNVSVQDSFNRPNAPDLGSADSGQTWTRYYGAAEVAGHHALLGGSFTLYALDAAIAASDVSVKVVQPTDEFWLVFRFTNSENYWRFGRWAGEPYRLQLVRNNALEAPGVETLSTQVAAAGDSILCSLRGSGILCSVNGAPVARSSDPFNHTATRVGLSSSQNAGGHFDDLLVTAPPPAPDLSAALSAPATLTAGSPGVWAATVSNVGAAPSSATRFTVTLPDSFTAVIAMGDTCAQTAPTTITCDVGPLEGEESVTLSVTAVAPNAPGPASVAIDIDGTAGEAGTANNHAERTTMVRPAAAGPVIVADRFERSNQDGLGVADSGQVWAPFYGVAGVANQTAALGGFFTLTALDAEVRPGELFATIVQPTSEFWLVFRFTDGGNYWRFGRWAGEPYRLQLVRAHTLDAPGVETLAARQAAAGDVLSCVLADASIECFVNAELVARTSDDFNRDATWIGLSSSQNAGGHFDDLFVFAMPPAPDLSVSFSGPGSLTAGSTGTWTVAVENAGEAPASVSELTVNVPAGFADAAVLGTACEPRSVVEFVCALPGLAAGADASITVQARPQTLGTGTIQASVDAAQGELATANNSAQRAVLVRPPAAGPIVLLDEFTRPNQAGLGVADSGQTWFTQYGEASISGEAGVLGGFFTLAAVDAGIASGDVSVSVVQPTAELWLVLRFTDGGNYWRFGRWEGGAYQMQLIRNHTILAPDVESMASIQPSPNDVVTCDLRDYGISCAVNGTLVAKTTDTFNKSATHVGLSSSQHAGGLFDNLMVTALPPSADIALSVTGPSSMTAGTTGTWAVTIANVGSASSGSGSLSVAMPGGFTDVSAAGAECTPSAGNALACPIHPLSPAQTQTIAIVATAGLGTGPAAVKANVPLLPGESGAGNNSAQQVTTVRPPAAGAIIVLDEFTRSDAATLGVSDSGQFWTIHNGAAGVSGARAELGGFFTLAALDAGIAAGDVSVTVVEPTSEFWVVFRFSDGGNYWRFGRWADGHYQLQLVRAHSLSAPGVESLAQVMAAAGDVLSCVLRDSGIECSVNGTAVARTPDPFNKTARGVGLSSSQHAGGRFDDLMVSAPPPAPDLTVGVDGPAVMSAGSQGLWTVTVRNGGTAQASSSMLTMALPADLSAVSISSGACGSGGSGGNTYQCSIPALAVGQSFTIEVEAGALSPGSAVVTAQIAAAEGESSTADNQSQRTTIVRPAGAPSLIVLDEFRRPDQLSLGVADTGQAWSQQYGATAVDAGQAALLGGFTLATIDTGAAAGDVSIRVVDPTAEFWLVLRFTDPGNYWRFGRSDGGAYRLQLVRGNALELPATVETLTTVQAAPGDLLSCELRFLGVHCSVNGVPVARTIDAFNRGATKAGLSSAQNAGGRFDDLMVFEAPPAAELRLDVLASSWLLPDEVQDLRVDVRNAGGEASVSSTATISLPAGMSLVAALPVGCSGGAIVACAVPSLAPGEVNSIRLPIVTAVPGSYQGMASVHPVGLSAFAYETREWTTTVRSNETGVSDRFGRPDTTSGLGSSANGEPWASLLGDFHIAEHRARASVAGSLAVVDRGFAFGTLDVTLGDDAAHAAVAFRVVDALNYYRLATDEDGHYAFTRVVDGQIVAPEFHVQRRLVSPQPGDRIRLVLRPDDGIFVAVNGQHVVDGGDVRGMFATGWGLQGLTTAATFREFELRPEMVGFQVIDTFDLSDGDGFGQPTAGVLYNWVPWIGERWHVFGRRARAMTETYSYTALEATTERAAARVTLISPGAGAWLVFRHVENGTYFRFGHGGGAYEVGYVHLHTTASMPVSVQQFASVLPQPGDVLEVRQAGDGTVECLVNGVVVLRFHDSMTAPRASAYGLGAIGTETAFDDFVLTPPSP